jgi:hypothetical protein
MAITMVTKDTASILLRLIFGEPKRLADRQYLVPANLRQAAVAITYVTNMDVKGDGSLRQKTTGVICGSAIGPM